MKKQITNLLTLCSLIGLLTIGLYGQTDSSIDKLKEQINGYESADVSGMSQTGKELYFSELLRLYDNYLSSLTQEINALTKLEKISDSEGKIAKQRAGVEQEKIKIQNRANILRDNLKNSGVIKPPAERIRVSERVENPPAEKREKEVVVEKAASDDPKPRLTPIKKVETKTNLVAKAPDELKKQTNDLAKQIVQDGSTAEAIDNAVSNDFPLIFSTSVVSGFDVDEASNPVFQIEPLRFLVETARTDKQIGASSSTSASTSAIDKPGFAALLGFAIENGYVEKNVQDTVLTLSTSPSAFFSLTEEDPTIAYEKSGFLNRIGVSASFNINSDNPLLANAKRSQLREYSVRYRFLGDRSPRSKKLQAIWDADIAPLIAREINAVNVGNLAVDDDDKLRAARNETLKNLTDLLKERVASSEYKALKTNDEKVNDLTNLILNFTGVGISDRVRTRQISISPEIRRQLTVNFAEAFRIAKANQKKALKIINEQLDAFFKGPLGTIAYINHRDILGNYSEFKVLYEQNDTFMKPFKLIANGGFSFYHKPNQMLNQKKTRDINFAVSLEGKLNSPFRLQEEDLSKITYSFTGRYTRLFENKGIAGKKADLASFQFLMNIPFLTGLSLPFSVTYANATELERKQGVRVNLGIKLDTDKIFELAKFNRQFK